MALTDAQAKIIAQNKKKREEEQKIAAAAAAKILASSTTKKSPSTILDQRASSRPYSPMLTQQVYRPSGTLKTPLNYLQEAAAQKITTQDRISAAKRSGAVRGDYQSQWQKNKSTVSERMADRRERNNKQILSEYDSKLDRTAQDRIRDYKTQWGLAQEAGDTAGMKTAHALAEQVRAREGYSGGVTGKEYLTADLTDQEKLLLNPVGQNKMKMAKLAQKQAFEAKDAKALQEATEEMARIMSAPGYRNQAAVGDTDAHGRSKMPGSPDAQKDAEQALAILKAAGYGTAGAFAALMESSRKALNSRDPWGVKAAKDKALENLADYDLMDSDDPQKQQWGRELAGYRKQKEQEELQTWMDDLNAKRLEYLGESYASGLITWEDYQQRREELLRETMTDAQWLMYQSQKNLAKAAEGQSMAGQFGTNTLVSGLQQLPGMAAALIPVVGPAVSLVYLGAMAAGQKAYELDQRGIEPGEVFTRSFLSAGVEVLTEKMPLDAMLDIVKKGGGENFLKALGKTLGLNFTEESLAYTGNWLLDKAYEDPEAKFSLAEMAANGLAGALIGGTASVGGAAVMGRGTMERGTPGRSPAPSSVTPDGAPPSPQGEGLGVRESLPTAEEADRQQRAAQAENDKRPSRREQTGWTGADGQSPGRAPHQSAALTASPQGEALLARVGLPGVEGKPGVGNRQGVTELERSGILAGAEEETIRRVGDLAGKLNREVRFFRGESWENGRYDPNTGILHLNTNGRNPIMQVFAHELTHSIETAESYDKLAGVILETMDDAELNERFQEITQRYQEKGVFLEDPAEVMNEVVAEYVETRLLTDFEAISSLVQTDRSLGQRILEWIDSMLAKLGSTAAQERAALTEARELYARALQETNRGGGNVEMEGSLPPSSDPASPVHLLPKGEGLGEIGQPGEKILAEPAGTHDQKGWEDLLHDPYMEALGEQLRTGEISEEEFDRLFDEYYHGGSEVFDYDTEETTLPMKYSISPEEIQAVQSIDRKSISEFTAEELEKTASFAERYWLEMGVKSPFFRAKHGDWRASDQTPVQVAYEAGDTRGAQINLDTGWEIAVSGKVFNETKAHHFASNRAAWPYLPYINDIVKKAVLLDSSSMGEKKVKSGNSLMMHSLYAVADRGEGPEVVKLYVEEMNDPNRTGTAKRAYQLQNIENQQLSAKGSGVSTLAQSVSAADIHTVADLFAAVKGRDKHFGKKAQYSIARMEDGSKKESSLTAASDRDAVSAIQEDSSGFSIPDGGQKVQYSIARMEGTKGDYRPGVMIDKKRNPGKHTATDESQRFRYQKPRTGDTQSGISTEPSITDDGRGVKQSVARTEGDTFTMPEKANAVSTSVGGITEAAKTSGAVTPTINTASKFSIPGGREKDKYSISGEGESQTGTGRTWTRETLPAKARDQLDRTERAMVNRLGKAMDVPVKARQTSLRQIARELGETYLATGRIDQETADRLFETAWEKGVVEDREYYDQYKPIKDRLRTLPLRISEEDSHDIEDYAHFKKAARGVLRLVKDGGTPVDVAYEEMKQTAPELFPAEITHPADQLVQMYEVARGIQKTEKSLADHYGPEAETYKAYAKNDFCEQVYDAVADWKLVRRYADHRAEELEQNAGRVVLVTPEQVKEAWKGLKEDRKAYEKVMAKTLLTDHDKVQVGRLLKGELEPEHLEPGKDNVKGILEVWKAREAYERDRRAIAEWNKGRKDQLRGEADRLLDTANSWKDKKMGLQYAAETMERNIRDIVPDKDLAEEIIQTYFAPVHTAQAESTRLKNRMRQRVKELDLSRKVKDGNLVSEAHAVQLYGEAMDNIQMLKNSRGRMKHRDGKTLQEWEAVVTKLWEENPNLDRGKVQRAVEEFRKIYDDLFEQMNEARIRNGYEPTNYRKGYFPHFQPGHTDGITGMFANVLGISTEITALPTTIAGMTHTFKPGIRWFGNAQERLGFNTAYDAVEGFDKYIEGVADVICHTDNIQRLRALASQTRYRTSDEGIRKQVDAVLANESLSEQDKENRIRDIYENGRFALSNFVINLDEYTNLLANKRSLHDRSMEQDFGRKAYNLVRWLEGRVGANMVAINPGSWLTNLIPLTQGGAQLGSGQLMKGMWETLQAYAGKSSQDFVDRSTFLTNRRGSDPLVPRWAELADTNTKPKQILRKAGEVTGKAGDFLAMGMEYIDNFTADTLVRARYNQNLKRGLSEEAALEEADAWTAGVMADRSKGATPTLFSRTNPGTKLFTQFQLEVNNQLRYLFKDIPRQEAQRGAAFVAGTILKFFLGAWLYDEVYEYFLGRRPAMDPIGILNDTVGDLTGWELPNLVELGVGAVKGEVPSLRTEKPGTYETITGAAKEVAGQIPFVGGLLGGGRLPVSNAIPDAGNLLKAATNEDWSPEKRWDTVAKELWKPLSYVVLPTGGGQIKKVIQGANAVRKGGSYTVDAEGNEILQYPVYGDTPWEMAKSLGQATVFGKTTLPTGKDWVERNFQNLSARETAAYRELTEEMNSDSRTVYETLRAMKAEKDDSGKRSVLAEADLTDREIQVIYNYLFGEKQPEGGYISSRDEDITALAEVGVGMGEFLTIQNQYAAINKMDGNAEAKATAFARWLNTQGYSQEESAAIQGAFRYYYQMPADAARYNEMTALDLDDETAAGIADSLGALEPLDGATQVSNAQKYRVVVDAGISEDKQMEVLGGMMQEAEYTRLQVGRQHGGVAPTEYVQFLELKPLYDEDGNGSFKQAEVTALLKAMNISNSSKAALWQMANKSWKPGKNPFSVDVGAKVYKGLNGE